MSAAADSSIGTWFESSWAQSDGCSRGVIGVQSVTMARRMSNRDRVDRLRAEADATERAKKEKAAATPVKKKATRKRKTAEPLRLKIVWAVKDHTRTIVKTFPFAYKALAEAEAKRLTNSTTRDHIVDRQKVPFTG